MFDNHKSKSHCWASRCCMPELQLPAYVNSMKIVWNEDETGISIYYLHSIEIYVGSWQLSKEILEEYHNFKSLAKWLAVFTCGLAFPIALSLNSWANCFIWAKKQELLNRVVVEADAKITEFMNNVRREMENNSHLPPFIIDRLILYLVPSRGIMAGWEENRDGRPTTPRSGNSQTHLSFWLDQIQFSNPTPTASDSVSSLPTLTPRSEDL